MILGLELRRSKVVIAKFGYKIRESGLSLSVCCNLCGFCLETLSMKRYERLRRPSSGFSGSSDG